LQLEALNGAGCEKVFSENKSGSSAGGRDALQEAIEFARDGDTLVVTRLDRLARSSNDLHNIIKRLVDKKVQFRCLQQSGVDTDSNTGKLMLAILGAVAEFETDIRKERQREGIEKAKAKGNVYLGRKPSADVTAIRELKAQGVGPSAIAKQLKVGRTTVYRALVDA
jgi:DNA invertase Pin-like site-specific DNA recombinase